MLNDIGPVIERDGLARIVAYVGRVPLPADWEEATALVTRHEPAAIHRRSPRAVGRIRASVFNDDNGLPAPAYDPELAKAHLPDAGRSPELWPQFAALAHVPLLVSAASTPTS